MTRNKRERFAVIGARKMKNGESGARTESTYWGTGLGTSWVTIGEVEMGKRQD